MVVDGVRARHLIEADGLHSPAMSSSGGGQLLRQRATQTADACRLVARRVHGDDGGVE